MGRARSPPSEKGLESEAPEDFSGTSGCGVGEDELQSFEIRQDDLAPETEQGNDIREDCEATMAR